MIKFKKIYIPGRIVSEILDHIFGNLEKTIQVRQNYILINLSGLFRIDF